MFVKESRNIEIDLRQMPFKDGETLFTYAQRVLEGMKWRGVVERVDYDMDSIDVSTHESPSERMVVRETVYITALVIGGDPWS